MGARPGPGAVRLVAPAKINLFLRVLHRRPDGFHELETVFQAVSLADRVEVELDGRRVRLEVDGPDLGPVEENLAVRAVHAFRKAAEMDVGVRVRLGKEIPAGAGLGGGSSDAAAVLRALSHLTGAPLSRKELLEVGAGLGADVPFFLGASPLSAATGRGDRLEPLNPLPPTSVVVALPPAQVATGAAYGTLAATRGEAGTSRPASGPRLPSPPASWSDVPGWSWNDFQEVVAERTPEVRRTLVALREAGGRGVLLSGSGAACFAFFPGEEDGGEAVARVLEATLGWPVRVVRTLERFPPVEAVETTGG